VKCWGRRSGQLGLGDTQKRGDGPNEMGDALTAVSLGTGRTAVAIAVGDSHTCALLDGGSVKCWGLNGWWQLGLGDTGSRGDALCEMGDALPAVSLGTGRTALAIAAGWYHTVRWSTTARSDAGGRAFGQLGLVTPQGEATAPTRWATTFRPRAWGPSHRPGHIRRRQPHVCAPRRPLGQVLGANPRASSAWATSHTA
jgi:hypothetical protein